MTKGEAINWLRNLRADIGKIEHQELWHYEQALEEIMDLLEEPTVSFVQTGDNNVCIHNVGTLNI